MAINFGTDGWRAVISDTFTFDNLRIVSQAVADAVQSGTWLKLSKVEKVENPNRIVIGYDTRFLSDRYAREVARICRRPECGRSKRLREIIRFPRRSGRNHRFFHARRAPGSPRVRDGTETAAPDRDDGP